MNPQPTDRKGIEAMIVLGIITDGPTLPLVVVAGSDLMISAQSILPFVAMDFVHPN
jgi:hypothetical protein